MWVPWPSVSWTLSVPSSSYSSTKLFHFCRERFCFIVFRGMFMVNLRAQYCYFYLLFLMVYYVLWAWYPHVDAALQIRHPFIRPLAPSICHLLGPESRLDDIRTRLRCHQRLPHNHQKLRIVWIQATKQTQDLLKTHQRIKDKKSQLKYPPEGNHSLREKAVCSNAPKQTVKTGSVSTLCRTLLTEQSEMAWILIFQIWEHRKSM